MPHFRTKGRGIGRKVYPVKSSINLAKFLVPEKNVKWYNDEYLPKVMRDFTLDRDTAQDAIGKASEYNPVDEKEANGWIAWVLVEDLKKHPDLELKDGLFSLKDPKALQLAEARYNLDLTGPKTVTDIARTSTHLQELQARAFESAIREAEDTLFIRNQQQWHTKESLAVSPKQRAFNQVVVREYTRLRMLYG